MNTNFRVLRLSVIDFDHLISAVYPRWQLDRRHRRWHRLQLRWYGGCASIGVIDTGASSEGRAPDPAVAVFV